MKITGKVFTFLISMVFFVGCSLGSSGPNNPGGIDTVTIKGSISSYITGNAITGAKITVDSKSVITDSMGNYEVEVSSNVAELIVKVSSNGFSSYSKPLRNSDANVIIVDAALLPVGTMSIIDPTKAQAHTIKTQDGASLEIPDLSDLAIVEKLTVNVTEIDVSTEEIAVAPGDFSAVDANGNNCTIVSQGMLNVEIIGETTGNYYSFEGLGKTFTITIPCTGDPSKAPDTIAMWYYDEDSGLWIEEGTATKSEIGTTGFYQYTGTVSHFTTWNMDYKVDNLTSITGTIDDPEIHDYFITIRTDGFFASRTFSSHTLTVVNLPPSTDFEIVVSAVGFNGTQITTFTTPADASGGPLDLGVIFSNDYPHFVSDLKISQNGTDFEVSWADPSRANFDGLSIQVISDDGTLNSTTTITPNTESYTVSNTPVGGLDFIFQALYSIGDNSETVTRQRYSVVSYTLTLGKVNDPMSLVPDATFNNISFYYYYDDLADFLPYTQAVEIPAGVELTIEAREDDIAGYEVMYDWEENSVTYNDYGKQITKTMDEDKNLIAHCWLCG